MADEFNLLSAFKSFVSKKTVEEPKISEKEDIEVTTLLDKEQEEAVTEVLPTDHDNKQTAKALISVAHNENELDLAFAEKFINSGGKFIYCENAKEIALALKQITEENKFKSIFCWEPQLQERLETLGFPENTIEYQLEVKADAAISFCEYLIAENGSILLSKEQATRRTIAVFPEIHIVIADVSQLKKTVLDALVLNSGENLPFMLQLEQNKPYCLPGNKLILNAQGPKNVFVLLSDEKLVM